MQRFLLGKWTTSPTRIQHETDNDRAVTEKTDTEEITDTLFGTEMSNTIFSPTIIRPGRLLRDAHEGGCRGHDEDDDTGQLMEWQDQLTNGNGQTGEEEGDEAGCVLSAPCEYRRESNP